MPPRELVDDHPAGVVPVPGVLAARVPQADDEQHEELLLGGCVVAGGFRLGVAGASVAVLALGSLALGGLRRGELLLGQLTSTSRIGAVTRGDDLLQDRRGS